MKLSRVIGFAAGCLLVVTGVGADNDLTESFRKALAGVDRIVVERSGFDSARTNGAPARMLEIKGADQVAALGQVVEVERRTPHCLCITSPEIRFYAGEQLRFSLTLHHSINLRDADGPWLGDVRLTEASAARFREWFAERGYRGFVETYAAAVKWQQENEEKRARFLAMFPNNGQDLPAEREYPGPKETERRIEGFRAAKTDSTERILLCWRGLAIQESIFGSNSQAQTFLLRVLERESTDDLRTALAALPDADADAWQGAYLHYAEARRDHAEAGIRKAVDDDWLVRIVQRKLTDDPHGWSWQPISLLKRHDGPKTRAYLRELAASDRWETPEPGKKPKRDFRALVALAELKDPQAAKIAAAKLENHDLSEKERLTLEIVCALGGAGTKLGPPHLIAADRDAAVAAWALLKPEATQWPTDDLVAVKRATDSYEVSREIQSLLVQRGVQVMSARQQLQHLWSEEYERTRHTDTLEQTREAVAEVLALSAEAQPAGKRDFLLAKLRFREGMRLNAQGRYEEARSSLIQAEEEEAAEELIIACVATGRIEEAGKHARFGPDNARQWRQRGLVYWAGGEFAEAAQDFAVAARSDRVEANAVLFAHLALVLAGDEARSRLASWRNPFEEYALQDEDGSPAYFWPETGILHLQGKMTWEELLASATETREDERAEAYFALSVLCRIKGDQAGEKAHLRTALETKEYRANGYLLALLRSRELGGLGD
jgi:hypothetical protein